MLADVKPLPERHRIGLRARATLDESPEAMRQVRLAIARAKEGDRDAVRLLYVRYSGNVYGYVRSIVRDEKEAEDLTQHVFLKLITAICKYDDRGMPFSGWLLRLARNVALDHLRRRRATPVEEVYGADHHCDEAAQEPRPQPARGAGRAPRGAAQGGGHAPRGGAHPAGDRRAHGPLGELGPRPAPPRPPRAAAGARRGSEPRSRDRRRGGLRRVRERAPVARRARRSAAEVPLTRMDYADPALLEELLGAVREVAARGAFTLGHHVEAFEREWAAYCECDFAVGVSSGTEALVLALRALEIGDGDPAHPDEVLVPANSFIATAEAVSAVGATPVCVDVDPDSHLLTAELLQAALTPRTRCVIPVHLYGATVDLDPILALARDAGVHVVEDACQAHGARYRGRRVGTLGTLGCFSFYPAKNLGAWGDGGAVVTSVPELAERVALLRAHGERPRYHHRVIGTTGRLDALQAAVLRRKLLRLDGWCEERRRLGAALSERLGREPLAQGPGGGMGWGGRGRGGL